MTKLVSDMTDEELIAELEQLAAVPLPADRRPGAPPRKRATAKPTSRARWMQDLFGEEDSQNG